MHNTVLPFGFGKKSPTDSTSPRQAPVIISLTFLRPVFSADAECGCKRLYPPWPIKGHQGLDGNHQNRHRWPPKRTLCGPHRPRWALKRCHSEKICKLFVDGPTAPFVNAFIDLLVEVADRAGADPCARKRLGDVLYPANRDTGQFHLDQHLLYARLPALISRNDGRLKLTLTQFGNLERDLV